MELVSDASLIFLDEPTTGLDATSAQEVMQYLAKVARMKGVRATRSCVCACNPRVNVCVCVCAWCLVGGSVWALPFNLVSKLTAQVTVVAVLHQPRYEILRLCDDITLLATGGRTVYSGTVRQALEYFSALGYACPSYVNPADFLLDLTAGSAPATEGDGEALQKKGALSAVT